MSLKEDFEAIKVARQTYTQEQDRLFKDGARFYADGVHERMQAELLTPVNAAIDRAITNADAEINNAEFLLILYGGDPILRLTDEERNSAASLRSWVDDEAKNLPLGSLAQRVSAATASGDRARMFLWLAAAQSRLDSDRGKPNADQQGVSDCGRALWELEKAFDPGQKKERDIAAARIQAARNAKFDAMAERDELEGGRNSKVGLMAVYSTTISGIV